MPAYYQNILSEFLTDTPERILGVLSSAYSKDGYYQLLGTQNKAWEDTLPILCKSLTTVLDLLPEAANWGVLLEYPLYRLRKRIDAVLIAHDRIFIIELKIGALEATGQDARQVEEYALDLRDFHRASHSAPMIPILCCTNLQAPAQIPNPDPTQQIQQVSIVGAQMLSSAIVRRYSTERFPVINLNEWNLSAYEPVPTIIEAATTIFAGHNVHEISKSDAENLRQCSEEVVRLIHETRDLKKKRVIVVTGVPGAGKTLAGLNVVHETSDEDFQEGRIIYLSGNTPLVLVIREALAQDEKKRAEKNGIKKSLSTIRHDLSSRIQHINDFLKQYYVQEQNTPPFEHAIVFDEAQRAWDHKHGKDKFDRDASEPDLILEVMNRHTDWAAVVCLVGAGQEINDGEPGMIQWGFAVQHFPKWELVTPRNAIDGLKGTAGTALFPDGIPEGINVVTNESLRLSVPMRSYRSESVSEWVDAVLENRPVDAAKIFRSLSQYPIVLVRSIETCRTILKAQTKGTRRCGLLASAGAVRLVADGLGVSLSVQDKEKIAHWYLKPHGDFRSSNSLEVTANEYTSQGLELDFAGICWGGDFVREAKRGDWCYRRLHKTTWQNVHEKNKRRYILNKYRVFLTRAREGLVLFVPEGDVGDSSRVPGDYDAIAAYLQDCGVPLAE